MNNDVHLVTVANQETCITLIFNGMTWLFAIFVWNPMNLMQSALITEALTHSGVLVEAGEHQKNRIHELSVCSSGGMFYPLVVQCFGCWSGHRRVWNI